ncbi:ssDNA-binding domain of telomere protection protein domain-containing protein [Ditylenchus destructor]|uniref:SsDNA-binding domain of telomere protection protein domain-containing protein n=1 Tax=Ditylenchus destructor TaxID=166010 RepID=A0AAD4N459_9BILA|nr:ssDNA-binding domain of telomere protection protein domain-containing protein [Ditylenchus destructor]
MNDSYDLAVMSHPGYDPEDDIAPQTALQRIKRTVTDAKKKHGLERASTFENIDVQLQRRFYDFVCQIIGVLVQEGPKPKTYLRVTDGTIFPSGRPVIKAIDAHMQKSIFDKKLEALLQNYTVDVCCWDGFAKDAALYKPGDVVKLGNVQVKHLDSVIALSLNGLGTAAALMATVRGIWHLESASEASQSTAPDTFNGSENIFHSTPIRIADSLANSPEVKRQRQESEVQESIVDETCTEQLIEQEEHLVEQIREYVVSELQQMSPERKHRANAEIREVIRRLKEEE